MAHAAGGTSVIRASPGQGVPMGQPVGLTNPQDIATHQTPESVIQDRRYIHNTISRGISINNQVVVSHQGHASRVLAPGVTVTSANSQSTVAILEKVLTSSVPSAAKANSDSQPQDLSNRFHPLDNSGFSGSDQSIVVEENMTSSGEQNTDENNGEQEGLLLRANSAAVRDGMIAISENASFNSGAIKQEGHDDKNNVLNQVKSELTALASPFTTNGGAVIITTQPRGHGAGGASEHVVIHTQGSKEEITVEAKWDNQQQQQGQQTYHWSQLVPFITTPNKTVSGQQQVKSQADVKPTVNGDVTVNGKGPAMSTSEARGCEGGQSRRESCGQDVEFDFSADDDEVFVSDQDGSTAAATDNKGRTRSLGSFSGKEEPKSPRKVKSTVKSKDVGYGIIDV